MTSIFALRSLALVGACLMLGFTIAAAADWRGWRRGTEYALCLGLGGLTGVLVWNFTGLVS